MKITYLRHSGFLVEMTQVWLLFDYYRGEIRHFQKERRVMSLSAIGILIISIKKSLTS